MNICFLRNAKGKPGKRAKMSGKAFRFVLCALAVSLSSLNYLRVNLMRSHIYNGGNPEQAESHHEMRSAHVGYDDASHGFENHPVIIGQLFTRPKGQISHCEHIITSSFSSSLVRAQQSCLRNPKCVSVSRHRIHGFTHYCGAAAMKKISLSFLFPRVWSSVQIGGCQDVFDSRLKSFHSNSVLEPPCKRLGLQDYVFERKQGHAMSCPVIWIGVTESLHHAGIICTSTYSCFKLIRYGSSGKTLLCAKNSSSESRESNTVAYDLLIDVTEKDFVIGKRHSNYFTFQSEGFDVSSGTDAELFRGLSKYGSGILAQGDMKFHITYGTIECSSEQILLDSFHPFSVQHAAMICQAEPHCTAFTFQHPRRRTMFCQGYKIISLSHYNQTWLAGFKSGFEHYRGEQAFSEAAAGKIPHPSIRSCPSPLVTLNVDTPSTVAMPPKVLCDECTADGICGTLQGKAPEHGTQFDSSVQSAKEYVLRHLPVDRAAFRAINPSIFQVRSKEFVTFRVTSATRCRGRSIDTTWDVDVTLPKYHSYVAVCELSNQNRLVLKKTCFLVNAPKRTRDIRNVDHQYELSGRASSFEGLEDPRGFGLSGKMFILCNIGLNVLSKESSVTARFPHGKPVRRMLLVTINKKAVTSYLHISVAGSLSFQSNHNDMKNLVPLVSEDLEVIYLVHSAQPLLVCSLDILSGICSPVGEPESLSLGSQGLLNSDTGYWSGSTPFVKTSDGYLGLVHRKQHLSLGRLYTHKWMKISSKPPFQQIWSSPPFRLPTMPSATYSDIQFAAGIVVDKASRSAIVSYGEADCFSLIGQFDIPGVLTKSIFDRSSTLDGQRVDDSSATGHKPRIKWEGPISDNSGFGSAARQLWEDVAFLSKTDVRFLDTSRQFQVNKDAVETMLDDRIITSNIEDHPDITVRFSWPLNLTPVHTGKLVLYFPWEFYYIPESWVRMINANVDEVWTPSEWCKKGFRDSGVRRNVHVIPHGSPDEVCSKSLRRPSLPVVTKNKFFHAGERTLKLLYHGGALWRKGIDLTLQAYEKAFEPRDDVILLIHSVYGDDEVITYAKKYIRKNRGNLAKVVFISRPLSGVELNLLYEESDLLLHLSRSEGFGLSILEAMARGIPVMVPNVEPMSDFVSPANGFLIPAHEKPCNKYPCLLDGEFVFSLDLPVVRQLSWREADVSLTSSVLREIFFDRNLITVRKAVAREAACQGWAWNAARKLVLQRIQILSGSSKSDNRTFTTSVD